MRIVSWTLAGPGTAPIIRDALRSAALVVDESIVVHTGGDVLALERAVFDALGPRASSPDSWPWQNDYGAARNAGLAFAAETDADWSAMVDTDERVICSDPAAFRKWLAALPDAVQVVLVHHNDRSHTRERFFRMPARYKFQGRTHEMYPAPTNEQAIAPPELIMWSELPKTREQLRAKFERDARMLDEQLEGNPNDGAARYYLGASLQSLAAYAREDGNQDEARRLFNVAINQYREHRRIDTTGAPAWHEGTAWSCFRAAECYLALEQPDRAIDCAVAGMVLDAGIGELPWIAAVASLQAGRYDQARCWAEMAKAHGLGSESERRRVGFRVVHGLTVGPDEVIAAARLAMAWDLVFTVFGLHDKPRDESVLGLARAGHPNALAIVRNELDDVDCESCGALEECPCASPIDYEKRAALRELLRLMGGTP
jgi:tetratricopeptide (TPR) repeat protein